MGRLGDLPAGKTLDEALALIYGKVAPISEYHTTPFEKAYHRVLAQDIYALSSSPPFDNAAVDGYAFAMSEEDVQKYILSLHGDIPAGKIKKETLPGLHSAMRIFTGAPIPEGADTVIMQEDVTVHDNSTITLDARISKGSNLRKAGEDIQKGDRIAAARTRLDTRHLSLMAASGIKEIPLYRALRVGVLSTGEELTMPGEPLQHGKLYDSNRVMLGALLRNRGCTILDLGIVPDDPTLLRQKIEQAIDCDLIISSGGMSEGREDHMRALLEKEGTVFFHNLAIRPGRPFGLGRLNMRTKQQPEGQLIAGLPGNSVAVFTIFCLLIVPLLARLSGEAWCPPKILKVKADFTMRFRKGRRDFIRATLSSQEEGLPYARQYGKSGAAILSSLCGADGFIAIAENTEKIEKGDIVHFIPFHNMLEY